jgi:hypothetical protein
MQEGTICSASTNEHEPDQKHQVCNNCNSFLWGTAVIFFVLGVLFGEHIKYFPWWDFLDLPISLLWRCCGKFGLRVCDWFERCHIMLLPSRWRNHKRPETADADGEDNSDDDNISNIEDPVDSKRKSWLARQRGTSFAQSIRKFSMLHNNRVSHGLIEAMGEGLEIVSIDPTMRRLLGWPAETMDSFLGPADGGQALPTSVHDLLPENFRSIHRQFMAKAVSEGALPSSLMHPLRNVKMLRRDGTSIRVNVCIGLITKDLPLSSEQCMFYALVSEKENAPAAAEKLSSQTEAGVQDREDSIARITEA